jgi:hypothetical protein
MNNLMGVVNGFLFGIGFILSAVAMKIVFHVGING